MRFGRFNNADPAPLSQICSFVPPQRQYAASGKDTMAALNIEPRNCCTSKYLCAEPCYSVVHCAINCSYTFLVHYPHVLDPAETSKIVKTSSKYCTAVQNVAPLR
jgi:hypothetical protein